MSVQSRKSEDEEDKEEEEVEGPECLDETHLHTSSAQAKVTQVSDERIQTPCVKAHIPRYSLSTFI